MRDRLSLVSTLRASDCHCHHHVWATASTYTQYSSTYERKVWQNMVIYSEWTLCLCHHRSQRHGKSRRKMKEPRSNRHTWTLALTHTSSLVVIHKVVGANVSGCGVVSLQVCECIWPSWATSLIPWWHTCDLWTWWQCGHDGCILVINYSDYMMTDQRGKSLFLGLPSCDNLLKFWSSVLNGRKSHFPYTKSGRVK